MTSIKVLPLTIKIEREDSMTTLSPKDVVIVDGVRSAMGKSKNGMFRHVRADSISAELVRALVERNDFDPRDVEDTSGAV